MKTVSLIFGFPRLSTIIFFFSLFSILVFKLSASHSTSLLPYSHPASLSLSFYYRCTVIHLRNSLFLYYFHSPAVSFIPRSLPPAHLFPCIHFSKRFTSCASTLYNAYTKMRSCSAQYWKKKKLFIRRAASITLHPGKIIRKKKS